MAVMDPLHHLVLAEFLVPEVFLEETLERHAVEIEDIRPRILDCNVARALHGLSVRRRRWPGRSTRSRSRHSPASPNRARHWRRSNPRSRRGSCPALHPSDRSEEHTSELQSLMRNSYAVFSLKKTTTHQYPPT